MTQYPRARFRRAPLPHDNQHVGPPLPLHGAPHDATHAQRPRQPPPRRESTTESLVRARVLPVGEGGRWRWSCLLYTSDAADDM
eukprot:2785171-Prymnesium_polylepis.1